MLAARIQEMVASTDNGENGRLYDYRRKPGVDTTMSQQDACTQIPKKGARGKDAGRRSWWSGAWKDPLPAEQLKKEPSSPEGNVNHIRSSLAAAT